ncbi:Eukaryotic/viral aspartic protease [Phytophthora megakarya]|uniref:Eukaryotic/viral aspartic protease n=1 Tax=Phytophthora megakarya TaxID=4795 RepID=A0A225WAK5_9STRA|nr:Eukaryotic/viral aspartic protease [Phytophthora megakarya]
MPHVRGSDGGTSQELAPTVKSAYQDQMGGFTGMSMAWQYYYARKRSEETPLDYLYQLNMAALRAKLKIKDGSRKAHREHVDHYIGTLGKPKLTDRLTLLLLADVDELEEVLRARERTKSRQRRSAFGSKFRQKAPVSAPAAPTRAMVRAIQAQDLSSESEGVSGSDGSDSESKLRRIFLAAAEEKLISAGGTVQKQDPARSRAKAPEGGRIPDRHSQKYTDLDCWKRLIFDMCGKRGHPTDRCLYACRGCGGVHEAGECPMEEFHTQIRKWAHYTPLGGQVFTHFVTRVRAERSRYCIYAYVKKATTDRGREESDLRGNTCNLHSYTAKIASLPQISEFSRSNTEVVLDLKRGESRGYWKRHSPGKWFRQAKISGRINQERATLLLDTGAGVSILDTTFARKVGCDFDTSQRQECVGIGDNAYTTEGRTKIKITLAGYLIGDLSGQNTIMGMDFMVPAGVRMDFADG